MERIDHNILYRFLIIFAISNMEIAEELLENCENLQ